MIKSKSSKNLGQNDFKGKNNRIFLDTLPSLLLSNRSKSKESIHCFTARSQCDQKIMQNIQKQCASNQSPKRLKFNIKTFIRFKPSKFKNLFQNDKIVFTNDKQIICEDILYSYDHIFRQEDSQKKIYESTCKDLVHHFVKGFNATVFAYGQTGSGKTHTMFGDMQIQSRKGIIPYAVKDIFDCIQTQKKEGQTYTISCSMLQIYREVLIDLLSTQKKELKIRQNRSIFNIQGLSLKGSYSAQDVLQLIKIGNQLKKIRQTSLNEVSSRSHLIFTLYLQTQHNGYKKVSKLNLIDLAGCQKVHKSKVEGEGLEQAKKINFSLACLGNTINSLIKGNQHIPYRDSKLTRLLQDSLSGNSLTTLIVTCSQESQNIQQTLSSLKFASRAKLLKTNPLLGTFKRSQKSVSRAIYQNLKGNYSKCLQKINSIKELITNHRQNTHTLKKYIYPQFSEQSCLNQTKDQLSNSSLLKAIEQILQIDLNRNSILKTNYSSSGPNPFELILQKSLPPSPIFQLQNTQSSHQPYLKKNVKMQQLMQVNQKQKDIDIFQIEKFKLTIKIQKQQIGRLKIEIEKLKNISITSQKPNMQFKAHTFYNSGQSQKWKTSPTIAQRQLSKNTETKKKSICLNINKGKNGKQNKFRQKDTKLIYSKECKKQQKSKNQIQSLLRLINWVQENYSSYAHFEKQILLNQIDLLLAKQQLGAFIPQQEKRLIKNIQNKQCFIYQQKYIHLLQKTISEADFFRQKCSNGNQQCFCNRNLSNLHQISKQIKQNYLALKKNCV